MPALRELGEKLRDQIGSAAVVLVGSVTKGKAQLALVVSRVATERLHAARLIAALSKHVGGSGGGRPDLAQAGGSNPSGLDEAIGALVPEVARVLGAGGEPTG